MTAKQHQDNNRIQALREVAFHAAMSVRNDFVEEQTAGRKNTLRVDTELDHVRDHMAAIDWFTQADYGKKRWEDLANSDREGLKLVFEIFSWTHDRGKWFLAQIMPKILKLKKGQEVEGYTNTYQEVLTKLDLSPGEKEIFDRAVGIFEEGLNIGAYSLPPDIAHHLIGAFDLLARPDFLPKLPLFEQSLVLMAVLGTQFEGYYRPWAKKLGYSPKAQKAVWLIKTKAQAEKVLRRIRPETSREEVDLAWGLLQVANDSDKSQMVHIGSLISGAEGKWVRLGGGFKILTYAVRAWFATLRKKTEPDGLERALASALTTAEEIMGVKIKSLKKGTWEQVKKGELLTPMAKEFGKNHFGLFLSFANAVLYSERFKHYRKMVQTYADHCRGAKDSLEAAKANAEVAAAVLRQALDVFLREQSEELVGI